MVKNHFSIKVCRRLFVTFIVQARNLLTHFLLLESIAHASSRRQQQRTCTLVVALTFRSWPQVSFFTGARPQKMLMLESTRLNRLKGSHSFFVYIFPSLSLLLFQINTVRWHQCGLDCPSLPAGLGGNGEFERKQFRMKSAWEEAPQLMSPCLGLESTIEKFLSW